MGHDCWCANLTSIVRVSAAEHGRPIPDAAEAMAIAWEWTGWPAFFPGDPETDFRRQIDEFMSDPEGTARRWDAAMGYAA